MTDTAAPQLHRQIVEVLAAEFERAPVPVPREDVPRQVFACAWGLYAQIHRHARAALVLTDAGMAQEAHVFVRVALEHMVLLHWVIERGEAGVSAMLAEHSQRVSKSVQTMREARLMVPAQVEQEIQRVTADYNEKEKQVVGQFRQICEQLDVLDIYIVYGVESVYVHPSIPTVNSYFDNRGILRTTPQRDLHQGVFPLIANCLIWAGRDLDALIPGHPRADELGKLAASVNMDPTLPPYDAARSSQQRRRKKRRAGG